jgi:uncharacterized alpha-E superfamily protein
MLSRVADSLFWMSRYIERAENTSRMLDVNLDMLMDLGPKDEEDLQRRWQDVILAIGAEESFDALYSKANAANVIELLTINLTNPHSISACIRSARENARTVREQISSEMWEQLNRLFHSVKDMTMDRIWQEGPHRFYQLLKEATQTFHGVTDATMTHGEGWEFIRVGKFLERADNSTRIIDLRNKLLQPSSDNPANPEDIIEWMAVLKSCSGLEGYRKAFRSSIEPKNIVEFLILHESFPRSVRFSINEVADALFNITPVSHGQFANGAQKMAGRLRADFEFCDPSEIFAQGLHDYLDGLQVKFNLLGDEIVKAYLTSFQNMIENEQIQQQQQQ